MADTYYVYDALGKLRFVLPPALNDITRSIVKSWDIRSSGALRRYAYFYRYDNRMLLVEKKLPGAAPVYYINDITGTPVFCQDGNLRNGNRWKYSIPDRFGRPVLEGLCDAPDAAAVKQMFVHVYKTDFANTASSICGTGYCPNIALKTPSLLTASYYDDYRFLALQQFKGLNRMGSRNARGLKTGTMTAVLEPITSQGDSANNTKTTPSEICSVVSYDSEDRIACVETSNILGGKDCTVTNYTFSGKPSSMAITHTASGKSTTEESYNYTYDALDRPLQTRYSINNGCSVTLADNQYDELGRLQTDRRNGSASLATEYSYNIHGMPTRISTPLYTESLYYEQPHNGSTPQYGGNISAIDWSVADESDTYGQRGYIFSYDGMSRLTAAGYLENGKRNDHFSTSYKYDLMGNILSLRREGLLNSGNYGTIDDLTYSYKGNQVVKIDDAAEESPSYKGAMHFRDYADEETEYTYDANGNMLTDSNKGITSIDYNVLDLPQCISTKSRALFKEDSNDTIYYTYSADGTKLRSTYKKAEYRVYPYNPETSLTSFNVETGLNVGTVGMAKPIAKRLKTKYYYCSNIVYDNDNISAILFDGGYASVDDDNGIVMHFYVKDHLGSNRLVVDGNGNIEEVNHYYPFGALMGDRCGVSRNNYKYIGKELDTMYGWNMQDHEARWYDPVVGRWHSIDMLAEKMFYVSPYAYCFNNPVKLLDSNGEIPTAKEGAIIAEHVYDGKVGEKLCGGWKMCAVYTQKNNVSFRGGLYARYDKKGNITEYVFATAGTYMERSKRGEKSIIEDFKQPFGCSEDMKVSIATARKISKQLGDKELTFVGHSKGGAEAAGNALATNRNALLYNPAAINSFAYGLDVSKYTGKYGRGMTAFIVEGEFLNTFNKTVLIAKPIDKIVKLPKQKGNSFYNHSMEAVKKALYEAHYN